MPSPLHDLDELTLRCRDQKARLYILEAVASYRAGAFRSAIVATWIAVCFDLIEKFRELALAGDKEAEKQVQEIERTHRTADVASALAFERGLLQLARDKFELISQLEFIDLERLQEDRNRCAHPSLSSDDEAYMPAAELARLHLHSAVTHLLQQPPVQGKHALERLLNEIESDYFPSEEKDALVVFGSGPLRRPRDSLVRNLVTVLIKTMLKDPLKYKRRRRIAAALAAIRKMHPGQFDRCLAEKVSSVMRTVSDADLLNAIKFLKDVPDVWQYFEVDVQHRLQNYVLDLPAMHIDEVEFLLAYGPLQGQAKRRVGRATRKELSGLWFFETPAEVIDRLLHIYLRSSTFDEANQCAKDIIPYVSDFSPVHIHRLLTSVKTNDQVTGSFQLGALIAALRAEGTIPADEFEQLLADNELEAHKLEPQQNADEDVAEDDDIPF